MDMRKLNVGGWRAPLFTRWWSHLLYVAHRELPLFQSSVYCLFRAIVAEELFDKLLSVNGRVLAANIPSFTYNVL